MKLKTVSILGVKVARLTLEQALEWLEFAVAKGTPRHVVTANAEILYLAYREPDFAALLKKADLVTADGIGVIWAARLRGYPISERVTGVDLTQAVFQKAEEKGWGVYFLGGRPEVVEKAVLNTLGLRTKLRVAGLHHGYFSQQEMPDVMANIKKAKPDILLVALGAPKQERFIQEHMRELGVPVAIGVGGTFDVLAGAVPRAPAWMRRAGLEWLFRLLQNPRRAGRMLALPAFIWAVLRQGRRDND